MNEKINIATIIIIVTGAVLYALYNVLKFYFKTYKNKDISIKEKFKNKKRINDIYDIDEFNDEEKYLEHSDAEEISYKDISNDSNNENSNDADGYLYENQDRDKCENTPDNIYNRSRLRQKRELKNVREFIK